MLHPRIYKKLYEELDEALNGETPEEREERMRKAKEGESTDHPKAKEAESGTAVDDIGATTELKFFLMDIFGPKDKKDDSKK